MRYDDDKLRQSIVNSLEKERGTRLHLFAKMAIELGILQADNGTTLNTYINDAIRWKLTPEQVLVATENAFGTADAIRFDEAKRLLRISDLKNGVTPASFDQLLLYAAFFFLEYGVPLGIHPRDIKTELRIYQNDDVKLLIPEPMDVSVFMDVTLHANMIAEEMKREVG